MYLLLSLLLIYPYLSLNKVRLMASGAQMSQTELVFIAAARQLQYCDSGLSYVDVEV